MAFLTDITARPGVGSPLDTLRARVRHWRARRAAYLRTHAELSACSDRDLADFGLHRAEIPAIARRAADAV